MGTSLVPPKVKAFVGYPFAKSNKTLKSDTIRIITLLFPSLHSLSARKEGSINHLFLHCSVICLLGYLFPTFVLGSAFSFMDGLVGGGGGGGRVSAGEEARANLQRMLLLAITEYRSGDTFIFGGK